MKATVDAKSVSIELDPNDYRLLKFALDIITNAEVDVVSKDGKHSGGIADALTTFRDLRATLDVTEIR